MNKAIEYYRLVISTSPFNNNEEDNTKEDNQEIKLFEFSPRLNSYEAFVDAHINLGREIQIFKGSYVFNI